jgi:hypothetical protein
MRANEDRDALIEAELDRLFGDAPCQLSRRRVCEVLGCSSDLLARLVEEGTLPPGEPRTGRGKQQPGRGKQWWPTLTIRQYVRRLLEEADCATAI